MRSKKQWFIRSIFLVEIVLFVYGYGWGRHGITSLYVSKKANIKLLQEVTQERLLLQELTDQVIAWNNDPFYKEQYAREQLHMGRVDEIIYM